jgi:hypothetical protein
MHRVPRTALAILAACALSPAQTASGRIAGTVTDPANLPVAGVAVQVTSLSTGEVRRAATNLSGVYVVSPLPLGDYAFEVRKDGFKTFLRRGVRLDANVTLTVDVRLEVGSVAESVTVEASAPTIETESQAVGNSRYTVQLQNLPIMVREIQSLVGQTAGVPYGTQSTVGGNYKAGNRNGMQILSDGVQLNPFQSEAWPSIGGIGRRADLTVPGIDAISEVKWIVNGGGAEYAQPTQVIVASKSGTNEFHGGLFEYYRSGGMGARRWEAASRDSYVRHQFGGTAGGPIKKNEMFYLGGFDTFRHTERLVLNARYPTGGEGGGDLSGLLARTDARGAPAPVRLFDPLTSGQTFPNNVFPRNRISPVATEMLKLLPQVSLPPGRITDFNAVYQKPRYDYSDKYDSRFDYNINDRDRLFARLTAARLNQAVGYSGDVPGFYGFSTKREWTHAAVANWTRTVNPSTIAAFQFSFRSMPFKNIPSDEGKTVFPVKIKDLDAKPPFAGPPAVAIGTNGLGISGIFDRRTFNYSADYGYSFDPNITKIVANHTLKAGFTFLRGYKTNELASMPFGRYTTTSDFNNARSTSSASGDAFGDFLLGYPASTDLTIGPGGAWLSKTNYHFYFQDDWKVTPRLTLNLGVRYDRFGFFEEMNKRSATGSFCLGKIVIQDGSESLIQPAFQAFRDRYVTASEAGLPGTFIKPNRLDFTPRIGAAWRARPGLVVRGGFGVYGVDITLNQFTGTFNNAPFIRRATLTRSLLMSQGVAVNSIYTFENPSANSSAAGADTQLTTFDGPLDTYPTQKAYTWNFTVEKDLGRQFGLRASYLGNYGKHLSRIVRVNGCAPGPTECLSRAAGDPGGRRWPAFSMDLGRRGAGGQTKFHSIEVEMKKRFFQGLFLDVNYAYGRLLGFADASDPVSNPNSRYDWGLVSDQPDQVFHWNYVYELPFGRGRRFGGSLPGIANALAGGWIFSGLGTWQSGQPLTVSSSGQTPTGATGNRADRMADGRIDHSGMSRGEQAASWFDTAAFRRPDFVDSRAPRPTYKFGNSALGVLRGPRFFTFDITLQKAFAVRERWKLQFRLEAFNPFNIPMLGSPDIEVTSSNFGRIRSSYVPFNESFGARSIQLGLRLDF